MKIKHKVWKRGNFVVFLSFCFLWFLSISGCVPPEGVKEAEGKKPFKWSDIQLATTPTQKDYPEAAAIFLLKEANLKIMKEGMIVDRHYIIKILGERGKKYADVKLPFKSGYSEIFGIHARTIQTDASTLEIEPSQVHEITLFPEYVLYSDRKAKVFSMPGVEDNCIIEYAYSEKYKSIVIPPWEFQEEDPVVFSRYFLDIPAVITYQCLRKEPVAGMIESNINREQGVNAFDIRAKAEYKCSNLPGIDREPFMPAKPYLTARILFAPVAIYFWGRDVPLDQSSWAGISKSYYEITKSQVDTTSKEMDNILISLIPEKSNDYNKIKAVYDYLRKAMRYVAIEIGAENVTPHPANEILKNKYGDCKDMATLFVALLKKCRIEAYLGLVSSVEHGRLSEDFPSFDQFNHVVVCVPARYFAGDKELNNVLARGEKEFLLDDDYLILDPTCKTCGFGDLPWYIQNVSILVIKEEDGGLVKTPLVPAADNSTRSFFTLSIDSAGTMNGEVKTFVEGEDAIWLRDFLIHNNPGQQKEWLLERINNQFPGTELSNYNFRNLEECDSSLVIEYNFQTKGILNMQAEVLTFPGGKLGMVEENKFSKSERKYPIFFPYKRKISSYYKITLTNQLEIKELPQNVSKISDWGTFVASYMISGKEVSCAKEFLRENCWIPAEKYKEVKEFYDALSKCDNDNIILYKTEE